MNYKWHLFFGFVFSAVFIFFFNFDIIAKTFSYSLLEWIVIVAIITLYSLLPDLDIDTGKLRKYLNYTVLFGIIGLVISYFVTYNNYFLIAVCLLAALQLSLFLLKHRGIFHSLLFGLLVSSPFLFFKYDYFFVALVSFYSHLLMDYELKLI